jgi:hypothetical protein
MSESDDETDWLDGLDEWPGTDPLHFGHGVLVGLAGALTGLALVFTFWRQFPWLALQ